MKRSRALSWILTVCMALTMLPLGAIQASALEVIIEIDDNPDPTVIVEIPDDPEPIVIVDLPDDPTPDEPPIVIVGINITGSGTEEDPFTIYTGKGMRTFVSMIEQGGTFSGYHACLGQDIDLSEICGSEIGDWVPIGNQDSPFAGTFDGKGHTISGLYIGTRVDRGGLFGAVTGTVRNLTVEGQIAIGNNTGGIAGENRGLIENCTFAGTLIGGSSAIAGVGGIAGLNSGTIRGCCNTGTFEAVSISQDGGIAGTLKGGSVTDCVNKGVIHNAISSASSGTGGIVGSYEGGDLSSCRNEGAVAGGGRTGGIAGQVLNKRETTGCVNTGAVSGRGDNVGGIVGKAGWQCDVSDCRNAGPVNGSGGTGGIVGYLDTADVSNCTNTGSLSSGGANTGMKGGIVGYAAGGSHISYCGNFGNITAGIEEDYYGGIAGYLESTKLSYCYNTGNVTCWNFGGGISGYTRGGASAIRNCFNTGSVSSTNGTASGKSFGGISGYFDWASLDNCYNTGEVKGYENVGGLIGNYTLRLIENCVSTGKVSGAIDVGALVGYRGKLDEDGWDSSIISQNYYCNEYDSGISAVGGWSDRQLGEDSVKKITREEYWYNSNNNAYINWDFDNTWYMTDSGPRLRNLVFGVNNNTVTISSVADLILFRDNCNAGLGYEGVTVNLAANLDLSGQADWIPIAYTKIDPYASFSGTFDGCGHTISGLTIDVDEDYAGLFGNVNGTIRNLTVKGSVKGNGGVGGIAGVLRYGTVENCNFEGSVTGDFGVGGIVGEDYMGTVRRCIARGSVTGTTNSGDDNYCAAGGIVGYLLSECTIEECIADIDVTGQTGVGGIAGRCEYSLIKNCLHTGSVNGLVDVGGIAGICKFLSAASTDRGLWFCYHHGGTIKSQAAGLTGGIAGKAEKLTGIMGGYGIYVCYYLSGTVQNGQDAQNGTTTDIGIGIGAGLNAGQDANPTNMAQPLTAEQFKNAGSFANWDFDSVWQMNAERPVLRNTALEDISSAVITFGDQAIYDGTEKNVVIESVTLNGAKLDDYVITDGDTATDVAETTLTISGTGFYTGTATAGWSLQKADPARKDFTIPAPVTADYTGSPIDMAPPVAKVDGMGAVTMHYSPEGHTDAGTYILSFDVAEGSNYKAASNIVYSYLTINKIDDPAVVVSSATLEAGGNTVDLSENVTGAEGEVTYAIDGDASGCSVDETTGVFTSGAFGGTVAVTVTIADSTNHNGREETIEVTVTGAAPKTLTGLAVISGPAITAYIHGDVLDTSGMVVTAEYNNQFEEEVSDYTVTYAGGAYLKKGDRTAAVSFDGMEAEIGGLTVGPKELTVTGLTAVSREADGTKTVTLTGGTLEGVLDGESVTAVIPATGEVDTPEAGSAKPVSFEAITLSGPDAGYYTVIQPVVTVDITAGQGDDPTDPPIDTKVVATPVLSEPTQTFRGKLEVTITCETSGAAIHYTLNGSEPTASSAAYTEGEIITINKTATLQAIGVLDGFEDSAIAKAVYTKKTTHIVKPPKEETLEDPETPKDPGTPEKFPFKDVPEDAYFRKAVEWALKEGVTGGTAPDTFSPDEEATRAQTVTFLWAASGCPEPKMTESPFEDVSESDYFCKAVLWAFENGITAGVGNGRFGSDETVTRGQVVTFLYNLAGRPEAGSEPFEDVGPGDYFQKAVAWAYAEGITSGTGAAAFSPDADCLRGQIITFLYQYFSRE